ncbi:hypothetical protein CY35_14G099000 [Sphagnum magellanicum]|nr:hypothetical protein CY35_14G099000 [Sphagnum magellanicum]
MRSGSMLPVILLSLLLLPVLGSVYQIGDSVPLASMEQFHGQRTSWLHQLGRHSPHFGVDTEVVMPIPKPSGFSDDDAYTMVEKSKINVAGRLFVLFRSGKWINIRWTVLHTLNFVSPWKTCNFS